MSTPQGGSGNSRSSSTVRVSGKSSSVSSTKSPGARPSSAGGGGSRKNPPQMKIAKQRDWTFIVVAVVAAAVALSIIGYAVYNNHQNGMGWKAKADGISGIVDYRDKDPNGKTILQRNHQWGPLTYAVTPPVGGDHNYNWQRCAGDVYPAQIANEHAVHSLEHGAVWITYNPQTLPASQVAALSQKVKGIGNFILMSPYPGLKSPITMQAWGFQLAVPNANDPRIDQFIKDLRVNASMEPGADCSSGNYITATGTTPRDLGKTSADIRKWKLG